LPWIGKIGDAIFDGLIEPHQLGVMRLKLVE
jgi:hypothetical protein